VSVSDDPFGGCPTARVVAITEPDCLVGLVTNFDRPRRRVKRAIKKSAPLNVYIHIEYAG
jgi:hypothetical protein